jgi:hypothetical protein
MDRIDSFRGCLALCCCGANLVEAVPMPQMLHEAIENFIVQHHVETEFVKRERRRADPEALARRHHEGGHE